MRLYLVQHGPSHPKEQDPEQRLTAEGRALVERLASHLARSPGVAPLHIFHSGKARARETAEILAGKLQGARPLPGDDLAPLADPHPWFDRLMEGEDDTMLVGHLPHLGALSSLLLAGRTTPPVLGFIQGAAACLRREDGVWTVEWMLHPAILPP